MGFFALRKREKTIQSVPRNLVWFGLFFGTFGLLFFGLFFVWPLYQRFQARSWVEMPCTVQCIALKEHSGDDSTLYSIEVEYTYQAPDSTVSGIEAPLRIWTGNRYSFDVGSDNIDVESKRAVVQANPKGTKRTCWVDPKRPQQSVLVREVGKGVWFASFTLIFPLVGYGMVLGVWLYVRKQRKEQQEMNPTSEERTP